MPRVRAVRSSSHRKELGRWIRERREQLGRTLRDVSRETGISASILSRLERGQGQQVLGPSDWEALSRALRVGPIELMDLAGLLRKEVKDVAALLAHDAARWQELTRFLEGEEILETLQRPLPRDPVLSTTMGLLLDIWELTKGKRDVRKSVEDYLRFQLTQLQPRPVE